MFVLFNTGVWYLPSKCTDFIKLKVQFGVSPEAPLMPHTWLVQPLVLLWEVGHQSHYKALSGAPLPPPPSREMDSAAATQRTPKPLAMLAEAKDAGHLNSKSVAK